MGLPALNRPRIFASLTLAAMVAALGLVLWIPDSPWGQGLADSSYDLLHRLSPPPPLTNSPVVLVYLDLPSDQNRCLSPKQTWPRELHAQLMDSLKLAGARVVVYDILFAESATNSPADQALAQAIKRNARIVLAAEYNSKSTHETSDDAPWARLHTLRPPAELFERACAAWGLAAQH